MEKKVTNTKKAKFLCRDESANKWGYSTDMIEEV